MAQLTGMSGLAAVLRHEMSSHVKDLERQLAEAAAKADKLQKVFDEVHDDFVQFHTDVVCMTRALHERLEPEPLNNLRLTDDGKRVFDSYHQSFRYILDCATRKLEHPHPRPPRVEPDSDDDSDDLDVELHLLDDDDDPLPWPMYCGQYISEMTSETFDKFRHIPQFPPLP